MKRVAKNNEVDLLLLRISTEEYVFEEWILDEAEPVPYTPRAIR